MQANSKKELIETTSLNTLSMMLSGISVAVILLFIPFNETTLGPVSLLEVLTAELGAFSPEEAFMLFLIIVIITAIINAILLLQFYPLKQEIKPNSREATIFLTTMNLTATLLAWFFLIIMMFIFTLSIFPNTTTLIVFLVLTMLAFIIMGTLTVLITNGILHFKNRRKY